MNDLNAGEVKVKVTADTSNFNNGISSVSSKLTGLKGLVGGVATGIVGALGAASIAVAGLSAAIAKVGIEQNAMKEQSLVAWETILGSADKAKSTVNELMKMGANTPFEFKDLDKTAKMLEMAGFHGKDLFSTLTKVGNAVSAFGGGADAMNRISLALFQMSAKGKISAEEMNQLAENGIPAWKLLAQATGKSVNELMKLGQQGKLMSADMLPKLIDGFKRYDGQMDRSSQTFNGMVSTMKDNANMLAGSLTQGLFNSLKGFLPIINKFLTDFKAAFDKGGMSEVMKSFLPPSVVAGITAGVNAVKTAFNGLKSFFSSLFSGNGNVGQSLANMFSTIKTAAAPILQDAVNFIKSIGAQLTTFWKENGTQIIQAIKNAWAIIAAVFRTIMPVIMVIVQIAWGAIKNIIQGALKIIMGLIKIFSGLFTGDFGKMWEGIKQAFFGAIQVIWGWWNLMFVGRLLGGIKSLFTGAIGGVKTMWTNIVNAFKSGATNVWNSVIAWKNSVVSGFNAMRASGASIFQALKGAVVNIWNSLKSSVVNAVNALKTGATNGFNTIKSTATRIFNAVKTAITKPIETAKKTVLGIIDTIKSAFAKMKITIPKPKLPSISVTKKTGIMGIPYPDFDVSWKATGGIATGASIVGIGERGDEAIVPLSQKNRMRPFAEAIAGMMPGGAGDGMTINNYFTVNATIREEADIQRLSNELNKLQNRYDRAGGKYTYGN